MLTNAVALWPVVALVADEGGSSPGGNNGIASKYVDDVGIEKDPVVTGCDGKQTILYYWTH